MNPFSAQDVSAPAQIIQLDDGHWSIAGYESHLGAQGVPAAGPFMATNLGVYVNVSPAFQPVNMSRLAGSTYGRPAFPSLSRSYLDLPDTYERPRRSWSYEDDDYRACGGYPSYRRDLDSGIDVSSNPPPWQYGEDYREQRHPRAFQGLGGELPTYLPGERVAESKPEEVERGSKRPHRLFGGRKPRRTKEAKEQADESGEDVDPETESVDSFVGHGKRDKELRRRHTSGNTEADNTLDIMEQYLHELKRERAKMKSERLQFQKLKSGLEDLLSTWRETEGRTFSSAPPTAQGAHFDHHTYQQSPFPDCPLSASTDPGPGFLNGQRSPPFDSCFQAAGTVGCTEMERYNQAWQDTKTRSAPNAAGAAAIPWPTRTLRVGDLSRNEGIPFHMVAEYSIRQLPKQITNDPFQLRKWNAFMFFLAAFDLNATYRLEDQESDFPNEFNDPATTVLVFDIDIRDASRANLDRLKTQLIQEKLRWHPDRMKRMRLAMSSELESESAKSVWDAVVDASRACERCLAAFSRG